MTDKNERYDNHFLSNCITELITEGSFLCSNKELAECLYKVLKSDYPTLYKWNDGEFERLNIVKNENKEVLLRKKQKFEKEIENIDFILSNLQ